MTAGATDAGATDKVAAAEVAEPDGLVNTAWYWLPLSLSEAVPLRVPEVAPLMSEKLLPPSVDTCHWTVGVGVPEAAAVKLNGWPALTD